MTRKSIERSLPALEEFFPDFHAFPKEGHRLHLTIDYMRIAARGLRKTKNQSFYSMREVARFFSVDIGTAALAYQSLENEGLLARVRGSRTVLLGKVFRTQHPARSVISMPVHFIGLGSHFGRSFYYRLSRELRRHRFLVHLILADDDETVTSEFADRLRSQADTVLWMFQLQRMKNVFLTLHDHGVQNILLNPVEENFWPANYVLDWYPAYNEVIRAWHGEGIRHFIVAQGSDRLHRKVVANFVQILQGVNCTFAVVEANIPAIRTEVARSKKKGLRTGCVVLEYMLTDYLCNTEPVAMEEIMNRCRVLFGRGAVQAPYFTNSPCRVDVISFSGDDIAMRIALDLSRRAWEVNKGPVSFFPRWRPNVRPGEKLV